MRRLKYWLILVLYVGISVSCEDNSHKKPDEPVSGSGRVNLAVTGRIGTYVGENLTDYVKSLHIFLFRQNEDGVYLLTQDAVYNQADLKSFTEDGTESGAGYTKMRDISFENLPLGIYQIVGVGNMTDSLGNAWPDATISGITTGNTMEEVIATVTSGSPSPRIFFGSTEPFELGADTPAKPALLLFRKVAMFALTLEKVPAVVTRIGLEVGNTYGAFNMTGEFLSNRVIPVRQSQAYRFTEEQPSLPVTLICLPTVTAERSDITLLFTLANGQTITIPLQSGYVFKENTITKLTATINAGQEGGQWNIGLTISVSADVEWNVDQEPNIVI